MGKKEEVLILNLLFMQMTCSLGMCLRVMEIEYCCLSSLLVQRIREVPIHAVAHVFIMPQ